MDDIPNSYKSIVGNSTEWKDFILQACKKDSSHKAIPVAVIPIAIAAGKLVFDLYVDKKIKELEKLEKAAQRTYSGQVTIPSTKLLGANCAILTRYKGDINAPDIGLIAIVRILKYDDSGFAIQPYYIWAKDAVAFTKKDENASIKVSIGFSVKAIGNQKSGLPGLFPVGQSAVSISKLQLGKKYTCVPNCNTSDLIPFSGNLSSLSSVSMSITETGNVGIDFDQRKAELKAIKGAIGPAIKDSLKAILTKDE